ncbi:MAG TPA: T9SS type A sorting domain-containing protein [Bacteroidales bacterium]|nr:T9SS type A sorting domain-containing protein [Bacteroidales bacterium]
MKKLIMTIVLLFFISFLHAQNTAYFKVADNGSFEKIEHVTSGGYITIGTDSVYKIQIIRWDNNFNLVWKYKLTDANISAISLKIVEANDGSFYFMGASLEHTGSTLIIKFSSSGALLWQKIYYLASGNMNSIALSKALGSDNGFLFGGGQCTLYNYIIKCDADGNIEWQKQYFYPLSTGVITCWSIIPDGSEYVISSGYNINSLLTFKIDALGNLNSHSAYTYTGMQIVPTRIVKLNSTGGYAILGNYNSSNDNKTEFVAIYNQSLNLLTFNELTVTYTQFTLNDITASNNGKNVVVVGSIYDGSAFTIAMVSLANSGTINWKKRAAGNTTTTNKNVEFRGITQNGNTTVHAGHGFNEGRVISIIDTNGNGLCNDISFDMSNVHKTLALQSQTMSVAAANALSTTVNYTYNTSASFNKVVYCGSISGIENDADISPLTMNISPNPASGKCLITYTSEDIKGHSFVSVYNISGQLVYKSQIPASGSNTELDLSNFNEGLYLVQISTENNILRNEKLLIAR